MKNFILSFLIFIPSLIFAQSTTILPKSIDLPKVSALAACTTPEKGRMVFNTADNKAYYCNGVKWQEMTGGGFTLPYSDTVNSSTTLLYLENTGTGRVIHAKSVNNTAIRGESERNFGVYGSATTSIGVYGTALTGTGIYGNSSSGVAGYFEAFGTHPTLNVYSYLGDAAYFRGTVKIRDEIIVDDNKGIVRSNSSTQQKIVRKTGTLAYSNLGVGAYVDSGDLDYETFGGIPTVSVGQVNNASATGEWYKVLIIPINVTDTKCKLRIVNVASDSVTFSASWQFVIVGPE